MVVNFVSGSGWVQENHDIKDVEARACAEDAQADIFERFWTHR